MLGQIQNVPHRGGAEGVDRLGIVADDGQALAGRAEIVKDIGLQRVGVLIFIDQHAIEHAANAVAGRWIGQHGPPVEQQIVVIQHAAGFLAIDIAVEEFFEFRRPLLCTRGKFPPKRFRVSFGR